MASTSVVFDLIANDRASSKFDHLSSSVDHSGGALSKFSSIAKSAAKAGAIALGAGAVIAAKGLFDMAQGAAEDEAAATKLAATLKNSAHATDAQIASTENWISAQGRAFGVADDDLRPALQRLAEATGSVTEAQDLASVAMDASAATGKSLKTISEALLRAHNGSVGGLSRYGIATKNAAGETLTFDQVVKSMSKTFEGQAAKAADTTAGKFARMKLELSEAGEAIGYKLLPYASDAADWLGEHLPGALDTLDKKAGPVFESIVDGGKEIKDAVTPLVKELGEAFGHLVKQGGGAGDMFHDSFLPTIKATADVLADLVNFIDNLPAPIKKMGGQAAIAAIAIGQMNSVMKSVRESNFIATITDSTKRVEGLKSAAKAAAGVGGILLLTSAMSDSADEADTMKHGMKLLAGGIAAGFAVGGPAGAAIGGLTGVVLALKGSLTDAAGAAKILQDQIARKQANDEYQAGLDSVKDTLDQVTGAVTANTRAWALQGLQNEDALAGFHDMGISTRTAIDAILGNEGAVKKVNRAYNDLIGTTGKVDPIIDLLSDRFRGFRAETRRNADAIFSLRERLGITKKALLDIPKNVRLRIRDDVPDSIREIGQLGAKVKHLDKSTIRILLKAANLPATKENIDAVTAAIKRANQASANPKVKADTNAAIADMGGVTKGLKILTAQTSKPKVELQGLPLFNQQMTSAHNALVNLDGDRADTYIVTHHQNVYDGPGGGGGGGGDDADPTTPRRMAIGGPTTILPHPLAPQPQRTVTHEHRGKVVLRIGNREFEAYVEHIADDRIGQAATFAESQR